MFKKKGNIWMIIGVICLCSALALTIYNIYEDNHAGDQSAIIQQQLIEEIVENKEETDWGLEIDSDMPMVTKVINGYRYIGILEVPDLDLSLPVMEDWSYNQLRISPCRYSGALYQDNMVIAGHNYTKHFSKVKRLPGGSEIRFIDMEGRVFYYKIVNIETLKPSEVDYLIEDSDDWDLTLFTCTYTGRTRAVIRCIKEKVELK